MESFFLRGFVLMIALTGFGASTVSKSHTGKAHSNIVSNPAPLCPPSSGQTCGMDID